MRASEQPYPRLDSHLDLRGDEYRANREAWTKLLEPVEAALAKSREGGGAKYVERHRARGKLRPRERIELLLDRDSHFLELCPLAGHEVESHTTGAALVGGIGLVSGVECLVVANESTVKGGAVSELGVVKSRRLAEVAWSNRLPVINLTESAGADLPHQDRIFVPGGAAFRDLTRRSEQRLPTVTVVFGSSTAGGAYIPGMSDYAIFVKKPGHRVPGRPAAGEDGHRRGGRRGVAGRRGDALARLRRVGLPGRRRARRAAPGPRDHRPPRLAQARAAPAPRRGASALRRRGAAGPGVARSARALRSRARSSPGWSTARASRSSSRSTATPWSAAGPTCTATRWASWPTTASSSPSRPTRARSSSSCATRRACRWCSCRTSPASWWAAATKRAASSSTAPSSSTRCPTAPCRPSPS